MTTIPRRVHATDGVSLAVYESGDPAAPTVVAVHGYPDNHAVWDGAAELLAQRFHVVSYDVRGTGESDKPGARSAYRMDQLVADFRAVVDAVSPNEPVHVLAHDWGSVQAWSAVLDPALAGRIASFTSVSGPSTDYAAVWLRDLRKHPRAALRQMAASYYIGLFQLPGVAELGIRSGVLDRLMAFGGRAWRSSAAVEGEPPRSLADKINGLQLYRANLLGAAGRPRPVRTTVPVQIVTPDKDPYITAALAVESARPWVENLTTRSVAGGHWVVSQRPDVIARLAGEFIDSLDTAPEPARPRSRGRFAGQFAVVTGGARGIGRATALELAGQGADVLIADVDDVAAKETVAELAGLGVRAWAAHLDVSDVAAWESFAAQVQAAHGVPDIMINNAGIGMGGPFLGTSAADWGKIVNTNLWSVIHGSRLFAAQMVQRGEGGHLVNIASAAAFSPSLTLPAYATTKAAVLMLTECLRAELYREGIGVTAVCPGFIDTDISGSTIHVGVDDATAARLREQQIASYRRRNYPPARVAKQIVAAVAAGTPVAVITPEAKLLRTISRFTPRLGRRLARVDLTKL